MLALPPHAPFRTARARFATEPVFLHDEDSVAERLASAADLTCGAIRWDESTGMRQVYAHDLHATVTLDLLRLMYRRTLAARAA